MIQLKIESNVFIQQIKQKVDGIKEITSPKVMEQIAKAAFTILGERFVNAVDREAVKNPKKFHHVYEWGRLGSPQGRLFVLERTSILNGNLEIESSFTPSNVPVPRQSGYFSKGAKTLSSANIFRYKASVMEKGMPISFITNKVTPLFNVDGEAFVAPGTKINILHPGGVQTQNAFSQFMVDWYVENANIIMNSSGLYERIGSEAARILNSNSGNISQIKTIAESIANSISGNTEVIK